MKERWQVCAVVFALSLMLAGGCVPSTAPMPKLMYINPPVTYLRDGSSLSSPVLVELQAGDQVEVQEPLETGWVKVRAVRVNLLGWVPKDLLVATPPARLPVVKPPEAASRPKLYVAVKTLSLRDEPAYRAKVVAELEFSKKVEKLDEGDGWVKVLDPESKATGWAPERHLEAYMLKNPRGVIRGKKKAKEAEETPPPAF